MGRGYYKGVPYISLDKEKIPTTTIRIPVELKERLDSIRKELQRDSWSYVSYGDTIKHILKDLSK